MTRRTLLALVVLTTAGCAPPVAREHFEPPPSIHLVGVTGLTGDDPLLRTLPAGVRRGEDVLATGVRGPAALEWLDGRSAVQQLRAPRDPLEWARASGLPLALRVHDTALTSGPEWVRIFGPPRAAPPDPHPPGAGIQVEIRRRSELEPGWLESALASAGPGRLVVVCGIPGPVPPTGLDPAALRAHLTVPVLAAGAGADRLPLTGRRVLGEILSPLRGEGPRPPAALRVAHWWTAEDGGMLVDRGDSIVTTPGGTRRSDALDPRLDPHLPRGRLLVLVRGSEEADLARLEILTSGRMDWEPWSLEAIDTVHQPGVGYLSLDLAVEPQGDGILLGEWGGRMVEVRVVDLLEDAPVLGVPIRDAGDGRWLGLNTLRIQPWSRAFWKLTRPVEFDVRAWWTARSAGVDLLWVADGMPVPAGMGLDD